MQKRGAGRPRKAREVVSSDVTAAESAAASAAAADPSEEDDGDKRPAKKQRGAYVDHFQRPGMLLEVLKAVHSYGAYRTAVRWLAVRFPQDFKGLAESTVRCAIQDKIITPMALQNGSWRCIKYFLEPMKSVFAHHSGGSTKAEHDTRCHAGRLFICVGRGWFQKGSTTKLTPAAEAMVRRGYARLGNRTHDLRMICREDARAGGKIGGQLRGSCENWPQARESCANRLNYFHFRRCANHARDYGISNFPPAAVRSSTASQICKLLAASCCLQFAILEGFGSFYWAQHRPTPLLGRACSSPRFVVVYGIFRLPCGLLWSLWCVCTASCSLQSAPKHA